MLKTFAVDGAYFALCNFISSDEFNSLSSSVTNEKISIEWNFDRFQDDMKGN